MAARGTNKAGHGKDVGPRAARGRTSAIAKRGIRTGQEFANLMSALIYDLVEERMEPKVSNAICRVSSNMLRMVELEYKAGQAKIAKNGHLELAP